MALRDPWGLNPPNLRKDAAEHGSAGLSAKAPTDSVAPLPASMQQGAFSSAQGTRQMEELLEIEIVIDRSGSMVSIADDAIGGFNTWLESQQALGPANVRLTLFDHEINTSATKDVREVGKLDRTIYVPRGSTALNDAVGRALARLLSANPKKAILVVLTDGMENASREFSTEQVKSLVGQAQANGWQITYLSADINAFTNAAAIGLRPEDTIQFSANSTGTASAYGATIIRNTEYRK